MQIFNGISCKRAYLITGALIGGLLLFIMYGLRQLNPFNTLWIWKLGGDIIQHQIGFEFFRESEWMMPPGCGDRYPYPAVNSIIYTDSIPLAAVLFKIFDSVLPESFQYLGLFVFFCFLMQGALCMLVLRKFELPLFYAAAALPLFLCNVLIVYRAYNHCALTAQWLIIASFLVFLYHDRIKSGAVRLILWTFLCCLAVSIHFYFLPQVGMIMAADLLYGILEYRKPINEILIFISAVIFVLITWYLYGGFSAGTGMKDGYGTFVVNLLGFIDPAGYSDLLPSLPKAGDFRAEHVYLGAGGILLLCFTVIFAAVKYKRALDARNTGGAGSAEPGAVIKNWWGQRKNMVISALIVLLILTVWAIGPVVTLGGTVLLDIRDRIPDSLIMLLSVIRASSRMIWPVWYAFLFFIVVVFYKSAGSCRKAAVIIIIVSLLQVVEMVPNHIPDIIIPSGETYSGDFYDGMEARFGSRVPHMAFLTIKHHDYREPAIYSVRHNMTMNKGHFAREIENPDYDETVEDVRLGRLRPDTIYCIPADLKDNDTFTVTVPENGIMEKIGEYYIIYDKDLLSADGSY